MNMLQTMAGALCDEMHADGTGCMNPPPRAELGGPDQATDPAAMPLADYISEVMGILSKSNLPGGEILVERVRPLRWAEKQGVYDRMFATLNGE